MNYVITTSSGALSSAIAETTGKAIGFFANLAEAIALHRQYRQTINELSGLSGRELTDLGLNSSSIYAAAYEAVYG